MRQTIARYVTGDGLRARAVRMSGLGGLAVGNNAVIRLVANLILARLLFPEAFGLMALVALIQGGVGLLSEVGIRDSLVRSPRGEDRVFRSTGWTLSILRGLVLCLVAVLLARPVSALYGEPMLASLLAVSALGFVIEGAFSTKVQLATRRMTIGRATLITIATRLIGAAGMVALASATGSVWSLVFGPMIGQIAHLVLSHAALPGEGDRLRLERAAVREYVDLGRFMFVSVAAFYFEKQAMPLILGLFVSLALLGKFHMAMALAALPVELALGSLRKMMLALFTNRPADGSDANRVLRLRTRRVALALTAGMLVTCALLGPPFVHLVYDARYALMAPMVTLIALSQIPSALVFGYNQSILARGDGYDYMMLSVARSVLHLGCVFGGVMLGGLIGAIAGSAVGRLAAYPVMAGIQRRARELDPIADAALIGGFCLVAPAVIWLHWPDVAALIEASAAAPAVTQPAAR